MCRKGENIYRRKDGRWEGRYIREYDPAGKARYNYVYGKSYLAVKEKMRNGSERKEPPLTKEAMSFGALTNNWLQSIQLKVKESSYVKYSNMAANHILPSLGSVNLGWLTTQVIEEFLVYKLEYGQLSGGGGLSGKTVRDMAVVIKEICTYGMSQGLQIPCCLEQLHIKYEAREIEILTEENQKKLEDYLLGKSGPIKTGILMSLFMGLRLGEICALTWENIDLEQGMLHIRKTMQRLQNLDERDGRKTKIIITAPKSIASRRDIPIPEFLRQRLRLQGEGEPDAFYLSGRPDDMVEPRAMEYHFRRILEECKIPSVNYYALRHTFATRCIENGFDVKSLSEVLGHSNVNITLNRYVHSSMELKRKNMEKNLPGNVKEGVSNTC